MPLRKECCSKINGMTPPPSASLRHRERETRPLGGFPLSVPCSFCRGTYYIRDVALSALHSFQTCFYSYISSTFMITCPVQPTRKPDQSGLRKPFQIVHCRPPAHVQ